MIDPKKEYRTRDGREVRIYATDGGGQYPIHGAINGHGWVQVEWTSEGHSLMDRRSDDDIVLYRPRIQRKVWLSVHSDERATGNYWPSEEAALKFGRNKTLAIIPVTIDCEMGEGLTDED